MWNCVELRYQDNVAIVSLNRPDKHNSVSMELLQELIDCAKYLKRNKQIRAVILQGNGPSFCSGMDLKSVMSGGVWKKIMAFLPLWKPWMNRYQKVSLVWRELSVPVIAAVHGNCFGAGLQIALGADIRFAHPEARFSVMEAIWGLVPDMGGTVVLRELVGKDVAMELTFTGRVFAADQAQALGLLSHLSESPLEDALKLCAEFSQNSPDAVAAGKKLMISAWSGSERSALRAERLWQRRMIGKQNQSISVARRLKNSAKAYKPRVW